MSGLYRKIDPDSREQVVDFIEDGEQHLSELDQYAVLIEVKACGLSDISSKVLTELFRKRPCPQYPAGWEVSGEVTRIGASVSRVRPGDRVAGLLPLDAVTSGCAKCCVLNEFDLVKLPSSVSYEAAAACIGDGVKAYMALYYQGNINAGDTVLFTDTSAHWATLAVQLTQQSKAKVLATVSNGKEKSYLESLTPPVDNMIELGDKTNILLSSVMEETGGLGADVILDNGARLFNNDRDSNIVEESTYHHIPAKHDIISCLGVGGRWVTSHAALQLDPPNSEQLYLRGGSVSFLFDHIWTLASTQQGKLQHILTSIIKKLGDGSLKPNITKLIPLVDAAETIKTLEQHRFGKVVVQIDKTE